MPADVRKVLDGAAPRHVPGLNFDELWRRHRRVRARRAATGVAAALLAVLVTGSVIPWGPTVDLQTATPSPLPVDLAERYIDARNDYDAQQARELVSDDFRTTEPPSGFLGVRTMELAFEIHKVYRFHYYEVDCTPHEQTPDRATVRCDYLWTTELHRIGNFPPTPGQLTVFVEDGRIARVDHRSGELAMWDAFTAFLRAEYPDFYRVVYNSLGLDPESTRQVVEQLPVYFERYEAWVDSNAD
ncbi:MAG TPA: hypothetical protein VK925_07560 [Jiangellaceae bacterium]|nr:hypothetical protein [Jiangellaceae bacterium]